MAPDLKKNKNMSSSVQSAASPKRERKATKEKNPLRHFSKLQLLELLAQQERELQKLREELAEKTAALEDRKIQIEKAGSIAEAALQLSGIFEAVQKAADMYLESVKPDSSNQPSAKSSETEDEANG